jgi:hypothetical protein
LAEPGGKGDETAKRFFFDDGKVLEAKKSGNRWTWSIRA